MSRCRTGLSLKVLRTETEKGIPLLQGVGIDAPKTERIHFHSHHLIDRDFLYHACRPCIRVNAPVFKLIQQVVPVEVLEGVSVFLNNLNAGAL